MRACVQNVVKLQKLMQWQLDAIQSVKKPSLVVNLAIPKEGHPGKPRRMTHQLQTPDSTTASTKTMLMQRLWRPKLTKNVRKKGDQWATPLEAISQGGEGACTDTILVALSDSDEVFKIVT